MLRARCWMATRASLASLIHMYGSVGVGGWVGGSICVWVRVCMYVGVCVRLCFGCLHQTQVSELVQGLVLAQLALVVVGADGDVARAVVDGYPRVVAVPSRHSRV